MQIVAFISFYSFSNSLALKQSHDSGDRDGKENPHGPKLCQGRNLLSEKCSRDPNEVGETLVLFSVLLPFSPRYWHDLRNVWSRGLTKTAGVPKRTDIDFSENVFPPSSFK